MEGKEIINGPVDTWKGSALWKCASIPAGTYLVTIFDTQSQSIATAQIIKL